MKKKPNAFKGRLSTIKELLSFLRQNKLWWMMPIIAVMLLLAVLIIFTAKSAVVPFVYTLF